MTFLFTPRTSKKRLRLQLNAEDFAKIGAGKRWVAVVTDQTTGNVFYVRDAACGAGCRCDALVLQWEKPDQDRAR